MTSLYQHFERAVDRELAPLLATHGYGLARRDPERELVLFTSDRAFVAVGLAPGGDPSVRYVDLRVGPVTRADELSAGFDLRQLLRHYEPDLDRPEVNRRVGRALFRATTIDEVTAALERLRRWLTQFSDVLSGDLRLFEAIDHERHTRLDQRVEERRVADIRALVEAAWLARDWARVSELLRTVPSEQRSQADSKRLDIAERRVRH
jgi:hypothetical protein